MEKVLAMILAGGESQRLSTLTSERAKPAVPFGGKYRIIDFTLSNCSNSGIYNVAVLTQFNPGSLEQHLGGGRPWDLDRMTGGLRLLHPSVTRTRRKWYGGTADAIRQNREYIEDQQVDEVLILSGDQIYTMRYDHMIAFHRRKGADVTIGLSRVLAEEAHRFGIVSVNRQGGVTGFVEKPSRPRSNLISMGIYVFNKDVLSHVLNGKGNDFGHDIIPDIIKTYEVYGYRFSGYYRDVGTIDSYWQANMDLIADPAELDLYDTEKWVRTALSGQNMPPVKLGPVSNVIASLISEGAVVNGKVVNSVISPGVMIEEGAEVYDSIIFNDCTIRQGAVIRLSILDKQVIVGTGAQIGWGDDLVPNRKQPDYLNSGITVIGKRARIPENVKIGLNCSVAPRTHETAFTSDTVPSGTSIRSASHRVTGPQ